MDEADTERRWKLFLTHQRQLRLYVRRLVNAHDAGDIVHEVALRLFTQSSVPCRDESFGAWCKTVARHIVLHERRALSQRRALSAEIELGRGSNAWNAETVWTMRLAVIRQLNSVEPVSRDVLLRRYVLEQTSEEIARETSSSPAAVRMRLMRLRDLLAESLGDTDRAATSKSRHVGGPRRSGPR